MRVSRIAKLSSGAAGLAAVSCLSGMAQATVLYDNLGAANDGADYVSQSDIADSFATDGGTYTSVDALLLLGAIGTSGSFTVGLYSDNAKLPGTLIDSATFSDSALTGNPFDVSFASTLSPNTRYWVEVSNGGGTSAYWDFSRDTSGVGVVNEYFWSGGGVAYPNSGGSPYQMEIEASASETPEPSVWAMMLAGFTSLGLLAARRTAKATSAPA